MLVFDSDGIKDTIGATGTREDISGPMHHVEDFDSLHVWKANEYGIMTLREEKTVAVDTYPQNSFVGVQVHGVCTEEVPYGFSPNVIRERPKSNDVYFFGAFMEKAPGTLKVAICLRNENDNLGRLSICGFTTTGDMNDPGVTLQFGSFLTGPPNTTFGRRAGNPPNEYDNNRWRGCRGAHPFLSLFAFSPEQDFLVLQIDSIYGSVDIPVPKGSLDGKIFDRFMWGNFGFWWQTRQVHSVRVSQSAP